MWAALSPEQLGLQTVGLPRVPSNQLRLCDGHLVAHARVRVGLAAATDFSLNEQPLTTERERLKNRVALARHALGEPAGWGAPRS